MAALECTATADFIAYVDNDWCLGGQLIERFTDIYYPETTVSTEYAGMGKSKKWREVERSLRVSSIRGYTSRSA